MSHPIFILGAILAGLFAFSLIIAAIYFTFFQAGELEEHVERFMLPQAARLKALGIPNDKIHRLGELAIERAQYPYPLPGMLFRNMVDAIEDGAPVDTVIAEMERSA